MIINMQEERTIKAMPLWYVHLEVRAGTVSRPYEQYVLARTRDMVDAIAIKAVEEDLGPSSHVVRVVEVLRVAQA